MTLEVTEEGLRVAGVDRLHEAENLLHTIKAVSWSPPWS